MSMVISRGGPSARTRVRWVLIAVLVLAACVGCSVTSTFGTLGDAGFSVSAVSVNSSDEGTILTVSAASPPGVAREMAVERAQRVLWQTQRSRIDRMVLVLDGVETTTTRGELTARFGPRDPALEESNLDRVLFVSSTAAAGLVVVAIVVAAALVTRHRRRRVRRGTVTPDPVWAATDLIERRTGQYVIDFLVWWVPTTAGLVAVTFGAGSLEPGGFPVVFVAGVFVWIALSTAWGWFTYVYWPARHHDQTFGMRRLGLRVVSVDGRPVGFGRHTGRWLLLALEVSYLGVIVLLIMALSKRHQRLGDMAAGTIVVRAELGPASTPTTWAPHTTSPVTR